MLPPVKTSLKTSMIAAVTALSLAAATPAQAWGEREQNFVAGVATALVAGVIINDVRQKNRARHQQYYQPQPQPVYAPAPTYTQSVYRTPTARAFASYSLTERKAIQRRLAGAGYYRSGIDGSFGPGTYNAVAAYARDTRQTANLDSTAGAYGLFDGLLY